MRGQEGDRKSIKGRQEGTAGGGNGAGGGCGDEGRGEGQGS